MSSGAGTAAGKKRSGTARAGASSSVDAGNICDALDAALSKPPPPMNVQIPGGLGDLDADQSGLLGEGEQFGGHEHQIAEHIYPGEWWAVSRPFLSGQFVAREGSKSAAAGPTATKTAAGPGQHGPLPTPSAGDLPVAAQEQMLITDLLYILIGVDGLLIRATNLATPAMHSALAADLQPDLMDHDGSRAEDLLQEEEPSWPDYPPTPQIKFEIDPSLDMSLKCLAERLLPMAANYLTVNHFAQQGSLRYDLGVVRQALSSATSQLLREYLVFVAQLEHQHTQGQLTLQKLLFYSQEPARTLSSLSKIVQEARDLRGGALLDLLYQRASAMSGDDQAKKVLEHLLAKSATPFLRLVSQWMFRGSISKDVYHESFVEERDSFSADDLGTDYLNQYWEQRYGIRQEMVPAFLAKYKDRILAAGKHLSVVRECGERWETSGELLWSAERNYAEAVDRACVEANGRLLNLVRGKFKLLTRLRSLKHYFLLDQGDFFVHFMDVAGDELKKAASQISIAKLNGLLEVALRTSPLDGDEFRVGLECDLLPTSLVAQLLSIIHVNGLVVELRTESVADFISAHPQQRLSGMEALAFDIKVEFPVSLVINRASIVKYQIILRFLLMLKHVERRLNAVWVTLMGTRYLGGLLTPLYLLRQRMSHFIQIYQHFFVYDVLEPSWSAFEQKVTAATSLDEILAAHTDFLDSSLIKGTLTDPSLVKAITRLASVCLLFANYSDSFNSTLGDALTTVEGGSIEDMIEVASQVKQDPSLSATLAKLERGFTSGIRHLLEILRTYSAAEASRVAGLLSALDFNGFYSGTDQTSYGQGF